MHCSNLSGDERRAFVSHGGEYDPCNGWYISVDEGEFVGKKVTSPYKLGKIKENRQKLLTRFWTRNEIHIGKNIQFQDVDEKNFVGFKEFVLVHHGDLERVFKRVVFKFF